MVFMDQHQKELNEDLKRYREMQRQEEVEQAASSHEVIDFVCTNEEAQSQSFEERSKDESCTMTFNPL